MKIYMFHYVKKEFNYPHFDLTDFEKKIIELKNKYEIISLSDIDNKINNKEKVLLTFDDGTKDHYNNVFPILKKYKISGLFFLNSNIITHEIFSVHYIHRLLSKISTHDLYNKINELDYKNFNKLIINNKSIYDNSEEYKIKRFLQNEDNKGLLFQLLEIYNISNNYNDYYISIENIIEMKNHGMEFGLHTANHKRLNKLSYDEQYSEIKTNFDDFKNNNIFTDKMSLSFPFGVYNKDTLLISQKLGIKCFFGINGIEGNDPKVILRLDCNELKELHK